jgi:ribosomal peptide maturation radical SAM protein 1
MKKVLLLSMPFGALERPALGLSLLKARLAESGIGCDVRYLTFAFAEYIGSENYQWVNYELPYTAFAGDWSFTEALYGKRERIDRAYADHILRKTWQLKASDLERLSHIRSFIPHFLDYCMAAINWDEYALVGFTSTFEQNIASLALAKRIKKEHSEMAIVFGGANWEADMGRELHRHFKFVDYVCSGESENSFPELSRRVLRGEPVDDSNAPIAGIVYRKDGESVYTGQSELIRNMDDLPVPDFSDYFDQLNECTVSSAIAPTLLFETSRGCWWGAKSHCTFCGLNGGTMAFRSKTARRALDELQSLLDRWQTDHVEVVDNILDMKYFNDFLPMLIETGRRLHIFYEVKANLSRKQVQILSEAGVRRIQPGIESLSDNVLKLMRKGTTALRNIQLLKWGRENNVTVEWNVLYGFPGETEKDYDEMLKLLPSIRFLNPPSACGSIRVDRFSPYYNSPAEFGLKNLWPMASYKYLYPFNNDSLMRIAYYFDCDYETDVDPAGYASEVIRYVNDWQRNPERGALHYIHRTDGSLVLMDTRSDASLRELALTGLEQAAYEYCDELRSGPVVARHLRELFPEVDFTERRVLDFLDSLVSNRLMVTDGKNYLSLAIAASPVRSPRRDDALVQIQSATCSPEAVGAYSLSNSTGFEV